MLESPISPATYSTSLGRTSEGRHWLAARSRRRSSLYPTAGDEWMDGRVEVFLEGRLKGGNVNSCMMFAKVCTAPDMSRSE